MKEKLLDGLKTLSEWNEVKLSPLEFIKTGTDFDKANGGLLKGGLHVIAGASGDGKSMTTLHLASILSQNNTILYISAENDIRIDMQRFEEAKEEYDMNQDNILYLNTLYSELTNVDLKFDAYKLIDELADSVDIVILDAWQNVSNADNGAEMHKEGNDICSKLCKIANKHNIAIIISWQLKNGNKTKSIDDISIDDISLSAGIARYASSVWIVKRTFESKDKSGMTIPATWKLKLIKSRVNIDVLNTTVDVLSVDKFSFDNKSALIDDLSKLAFTKYR